MLSLGFCLPDSSPSVCSVRIQQRVQPIINLGLYPNALAFWSLLCDPTVSSMFLSCSWGPDTIVPAHCTAVWIAAWVLHKECLVLHCWQALWVEQCCDGRVRLNVPSLFQDVAIFPELSLLQCVWTWLILSDGTPFIVHLSSPLDQCSPRTRY